MKNRWKKIIQNFCTINHIRLNTIRWSEWCGVGLTGAVKVCRLIALWTGTKLHRQSRTCSVCSIHRLRAPAAWRKHWLGLDLSIMLMALHLEVAHLGPIFVTDFPRCFCTV